MTPAEQQHMGMGRGKVFPAASARSLINPARRLVQSPRRTVDAIGLRPSDRVLELGCGPGFFSPWIVKAVPSGRAILFDLQVEMLRMARQRVPGAAYVQGSGADLPLLAGGVDAVFIAVVLGEIPDPAACLRECRRVLRDGGTLAIAETRRDSDFIPLADLRHLVEPCGFRFADKRGVGWQYVALFRNAPLES